MGLIHKPKLRDYWITDSMLHTPFPPSIMSRNRFQSIHSMLHFNDSTNFIPRGNPNHDPLFKIRPILSILGNCFSSSATPGQHLSIDEAMCGFRGRLSFKVYNRNKPTKWGMKLYEVCDSSTGYVVRVEVFSGHAGNTSELVLRLLSGLLNRNHIVYMDRYYNSLTLTDELLRKNTQVVGTIQSNRRGLPPPLKAAKLKRGEVISFRKGRILCLKWRDKRDVLMISTIHDDSLVPVQRRGESVPVQKPMCVVDYNNHMGGVDQSDQLISYYPFQRKTMKWYKKLFFRLFYIFLVNSQIILNHKRQALQLSPLSLYDFLHQASLDFSLPAPDRPPTVQPALILPARLTERHFPRLIPPTQKQRPTRTCIVCRRRNVRKETRYTCVDCNVCLCIIPCFESYHTQLEF